MVELADQLFRLHVSRTVPDHRADVGVESRIGGGAVRLPDEVVEIGHAAAFDGVDLSVDDQQFVRARFRSEVFAQLVHEDVEVVAVG